jgi:hypothetical protein
MDGQVTMSAKTVDAVVHARQLGELPVLLRPDPIWTDEEMDQRARAVQLDEDTIEGLYALTHPVIEYGAVLRVAGEQRSVFVAERGRQMVVAERAGDLVTMTVVRDRSAVAELVGHIPDAIPATVDVVNVRQSELAACGGDARGFDVSLGSRERDLRTVAALIDRSLVGQGELYVGVRDQFARVALSKPVRYQDYDLGRVLVVVADGFVSLAPATKATLARRINEEYVRITQSSSA